LQDPNLDRERSFVIGDRMTDLALAENMGLRGIRIEDNRDWPKIARLILQEPRIGYVSRQTKETSIEVHVDLDGTERQIKTGIGFFDHMLEQLSYHGGFALKVETKGDLHIDEHHTVEDTAIAVGSALRKALGDKVGIERFGFYLPMDDALVHVALDLSGRSFFVFAGSFAREKVGELSTEMVQHFFRSFADALGANLNMKVEGENTHHMVEGCFKGVGRALRAAVKKNGDLGVGSTKGMLS
jgi:imidazoleglycerol-phosphate dehydratase/histidinol-phosphatase